MSTPDPPTYTTFDGFQCIAHGPLAINVSALRRARDDGAVGPVLIFDDASGQSVDVDLRDRHAAPAGPIHDSRRGRGRPKLGVVAREVTLLPRHWEWLASQPGGASVALRRLVEDARRANVGRDALRQAHTRAYHFMVAIAGDLPGYEEATRALFANDRDRFKAHVAAWPADVREHAMRLGFGAD